MEYHMPVKQKILARIHPGEDPQEISPTAETVMEIELKDAIWTMTRLARAIDRLDDHAEALNYKLYKLCMYLDEDML